MKEGMRGKTRVKENREAGVEVLVGKEYTYP
jgi:hypothetical protein